MTLRVYTFSPAWGLPTTGPFALKLLAWLRLAGIAYEQRFEDDPRKGPKGKNPWIEENGTRTGDSGLIIAMLARRTGFDIDAPLTAVQRAEGLAWQRLVEEHLHQVLEWELFCHPAGAAFIDAAVRAQVPRPAAALVAGLMKRHFARQLRARGIARHAPEVIAAAGRADLDALAARLAAGPGPFLHGRDPSMADVAIWGLTAPLIAWPMATPVATYARTLAPLTAMAAAMARRTGFSAGERATAAA